MKFLSAFYKRKIAFAGLIIIGVMIIFALLAPLIAPFDPQALNPVDKLRPPDGTYWFGTDNFGRDLFSRVVYGARTSLIGSAGVILFSLSLGILAGVTSGYIKGVEPYLMRLIDVLMAFPPLLLALVLVSILGRGMVTSSSPWGPPTSPDHLDRLRPHLKLREEPYIEAAISSGVRQIDIIFRHILPNMMSPLIVQATFTFAFSLLDMAALDFLGLGIPPSIPSWGNMLSEGRMYLTRAPWLLIFPGACIVLTVLSFNLAGDVLRDRPIPPWRDIEGCSHGGATLQNIPPSLHRGSKGELSLTGGGHLPRGRPEPPYRPGRPRPVGSRGGKIHDLLCGRVIRPHGKIVSGKIHFKGTNLLSLKPREMRKIRGKDISMIFQEPMTS
ncbi:hypothetical protein MASR2M17_19710 [Aminivibrio sp.]